MKSERRVVIALVLVTILVAAALSTTLRGSAPSEEELPRLKVLAKDVGVSMQSDAAYATFYLGSICVEGAAGEVTILSVDPLKSQGGGMITDVSVFPFDQLGAQPGADMKRLNRLPQFKGTRTVSEGCRQKDGVETQLAVEIHNPGNGSATVRGLRFRYESEGKTRFVDSSVSIGLCSTGQCL